jgi:dihydroorotate dehydrogenase electron transfer subunit
MKQALCPITSNVEISSGVWLMWIEAPDIAIRAQPGQFITVGCSDFTLRRPFSVHQVGGNNVIARPDSIGAKQSQVALLFKITGKGTYWLSQRKAGEKIDIIGPLGKGFSIEPESKNLLLVAGGIGIAPLVFLMQQASSRHQITLIHGASTAAQIYPPSLLSLTLNPSPLKGEGKSEGEERSKSLPNGIQFIPVTEDGSMGHKGMATDILPDFLDWADQVYACGPVDMYKAMAEMSLRVPILSGRSNLKLAKCQVSLEVRMGCGFGACYGCTINTRKGPKQVCRDGPVFEPGDIIWKEIRI